MCKTPCILSDLYDKQKKAKIITNKNIITLGTQRKGDNHVLHLSPFYQLFL